MPMQPVNISDTGYQMFLDDESVFAPRERGLERQAKQNALARQMAVRNALAANIDPATGRTNWQNAYAMGGQDVAPDLQQMQQADMATQAELFHKRAQGQKAATDAEIAYWSQQRDTAARIGDQASWSTWRSTLPGEFQQFVPEQYSDDNKRKTLATADKALALHFQQVDTGGGGYTLQMPETGGGPAAMVPGSQYTKTMPPEALAREKRLAAQVDPASYPNVYRAVEEGRIPLARVNSRTAAIFEGVLARNPDADLNAISLDQISAGAGARTAGTTKANIGIASDEANRMIDVTRSLIPQVKATDFPSLNALKNAISRGTGDPNIVALNTSLNSLINSYARAINPKGVATVSDKNHARELIDSAMANGQLDAALNVMQREMEAALGAARAGSGRQKPSPETPATSAAPPAAAIEYLKNNPGMAAQFDAKYGAGASAKYLKAK